MHTLRLGLALLLAGSTAPAIAGTSFVTVGPDSACDFSSLQAAINAASEGQLIRLMSGTYSGQGYQIQNRSLTLRGGYPDCSPSASPNGVSVLNAGQTATVVDVFTGTTTTPRTVVLENLRLSGGRAQSLAGGLQVEGRPGVLRVDLRNVEIRGNESQVTGGGGIQLLTTGTRVGAGLMLTIDNASQIVRNRATGAAGAGGGLLCLNSFDQGTGVLMRVGSSLFFENEAVDGGGMAFRGCRGVRLHNGGSFLLFLPNGGIVANVASGRGGGLFLDQGSEVELTAAPSGGFGDLADAALISNNQAQRGGGFFATGTGTALSLVGTRVSTNIASSAGGGGFVDSEAQLSLRELIAAPCLPNQSSGGVTTLPPCSLIDDNQASSEGGALDVQNGAQANLRNTYVRGNSANFASAFMVRSTSGNASLRLEGVQVTGNTGFFPLFLISEAGRSGLADVRFSTLAANQHPNASAAVIRSGVAAGGEAEIQLRSSIVHEPGRPLASRTDTGSHFLYGDCTIGAVALGDSGLDASSLFYSATDPRFRNPAGGDFRLRPDSPAIDYCIDNTVPVAADLDGRLRGTSWTGPPRPAAPNAAAGGRYDLGAFEAQALSEALFANGFE